MFVIGVDSKLKQKKEKFKGHGPVSALVSLINSISSHENFLLEVTI